MSEIITDKQCPIQFRWIVKKILIVMLSIVPSYGVAFGIIILLYQDATAQQKIVINSMVFYLVIFTAALIGLLMITLLLKRLTFHYAIEEKFLNADQGVISKRKSHIPYFRIQHVIVKRDLWDRMLGLASVAVENAAQGGDGMGGQSKIVYAMVGGLAGVALRKQLAKQVDIIGFNGNKMGMPGLTLEHAEKVKKLLLERIQDSMMEDKTSGL